MTKKMIPGMLIPALPVLIIMILLCELGKRGIAGAGAALLAAGVFAFLTVASARGEWPKYTKPLLWAGWILIFALIFILFAPKEKRIAAYEGKSPVYTGTVKVAQGELRGVKSADGEIEIYAGIPYAKAPVGELRWREPQDAESWQGVFDADTFGPMSMQPAENPVYSSLKRIIGYHDYKFDFSNTVPAVSEDSLYLNVWKPAGECENLPVLVFIHGGSLKTGQSYYFEHSGEGLAREGAIAVTIAYRLGVFGFYADSELAAESENGTTGSYGLFDQIKALEWVRDNIAAFGGDPDNVTLAGESAGSACVSALCASPLAKGLFRRAVLESSTLATEKPPHSFRQMDEALSAAAKTRERFGASTVSDLRSVPAEKLVSETERHHHITVDGYALERTPYEYHKDGVFNAEAIMHGYNGHESAPFIIFDHANHKNYEKKLAFFGDFAKNLLELYPAADSKAADVAWAEIYGAFFFDYPHYRLNGLAVESGVPTYEYLFTKQNGSLSDWHSGEMIYLYGNIPDGSRLFDARDRELSGQMLSYLLNFMKTGNPNGEGLPVWEKNTDSATLMEFGDKTEMTKEKKLPLYSVFDEYVKQ